ncbi:MAG: ATP-dependent zinc protease [Desulfuromonas sp.]|nr:MAG: ATP-dependent zinc protease [Desulfuromonas sp.]
MPVVGWREWVSLPDLGLPGIKAKIDTGARTSALHAFFVESYRQEGQEFVRFCVHPLPGTDSVERICHARVKDCRRVTDSGGHVEERYVIESRLQIAEYCFPIELTLTNRDTMKFRMLLGRTALQKMNVLVAPDRSYLLGPSLRHAYHPTATEASQ